MQCCFHLDHRRGGVADAWWRRGCMATGSEADCGRLVRYATIRYQHKSSTLWLPFFSFFSSPQSNSVDMQPITVVAVIPMVNSGVWMSLCLPLEANKIVLPQTSTVNLALHTKPDRDEASKATQILWNWGSLSKWLHDSATLQQHSVTSLYDLWWLAALTGLLQVVRWDLNSQWV